MIRNICVCLTSVLFSAFAPAEVTSTTVWAVNVGGEQISSTPLYEADLCDPPDACSTAGPVAGTQNQPLYKSFRRGELPFAKPLPNGLYDITLHFMGPAQGQHCPA